MNLPYSTLNMIFTFPFSCEDVFGWWTDLQPAGYVGLTLRRIDVLGREDNKIRVLTHWRYLWFDFTMVETLIIESDEKWIWYSHFLGIPAKESFTLKKRDHGCELSIHSVMSPNGLRKILFLIIGWYWRYIDRKEWNAAAQACIMELSATKGSG